MLWGALPLIPWLVWTAKLTPESTPSLNEWFQMPAFSPLDYGRARQWLPRHYCNPVFALPSSTRGVWVKLCLERQNEERAVVHTDFISMKPIASWVIRSNFSIQDISGPRQPLQEEDKGEQYFTGSVFQPFKCPLSPSTQWSPYLLVLHTNLN